MEQMVMTSGINVQLEQVLKYLKPQEIPVQNPPSPKELECLGMRLADLDVKFNKGYVEISFDYKKVKNPIDPEVCDKFMKALQQGPQSMMDQAKDMLGGDSFTDYLKKKTDEVKEEAEGMGHRRERKKKP